MARSVPVRARLLTLLLSALAMLALAVPAASASSPAAVPASPVPGTPSFGPAIDPYAAYEPENTCQPQVQPGIIGLRDEVLRPAYGGSFGDYLTTRACSSRSSGHQEGRALDWMMDSAVPAEYANAKAFLEWLLAPDQYGNKHAMARRLGIMYILYNNKMWRAYRPDAGWQPQVYAGVDCALRSSEYRTLCHRDHPHISLSWAGALKQTSWWGARSVAPAKVAECKTPPLPARPTPPSTAGMTYVALPRPVTIVNTARGLGSPGACRVGPAGRLDVQVTGRGGVPATGVGAVVLNVVGTGPTRSTSLAAYPAGLPYPGNHTLSVRARGARAASLISAVGTDGKVSVLNSVGQIDLTVEVLGYYRSADAVPEPPPAPDIEAVHETADELTYHPVRPVRVSDSRREAAYHDAPYDKDETRTVQVAGDAVPKTARAVIVNVTARSLDTSGSVGVVAHGASPSTITTTFGVEQRVSNRAVVTLSVDGKIDIKARARTHVVVDVIGWYADTSVSDGTRYVPLFPQRVLDTRSGYGLPAPLGTEPADLPVAGRGGVPASGVRAVVMTLTGWQGTQDTYLSTRGGVADLNLALGDAAANLVVPEVHADGTVSLHNGRGSTQVLADVLGYYR